MYVVIQSRCMIAMFTATAICLFVGCGGEPTECIAESAYREPPVWTWGDDSHGQLGPFPSPTDHPYKPSATSEIGETTEVAAGYFHSMAIDSDGSLWTWVDCREWEPGIEPNSESTGPPSRVANLVGVRAVADGRFFSFAVLADGTVHAWGANHAGQLGDGTTEYQAKPVCVLGIVDVKAVAAGREFAVALKDDGTVWAWGANEYGELGIGTKDSRATPTKMVGLNRVVAVACGDNMAMMLKDDGTVWGCGYNRYGNLGDGTKTDRRSPVQANGLDSIVAIACGANHTVAIKDDATVWAWGYGFKGELGLEEHFRDEQLTATKIPRLKNITDVAAGWNFSLAVDREGDLWAFGRNWDGQFGTSDFRESLIPIKVRGISGIEQLACGTGHAIAVKSKPQSEVTRSKPN